MNHNTIPENYQLNCLLVVLVKRNQQDIAIPLELNVFNRTIIPLTFVGYETRTIANYALRASLAIYHSLCVRSVEKEEVFLCSMTVISIKT